MSLKEKLSEVDFVGEQSNNPSTKETIIKFNEILNGSAAAAPITPTEEEKKEIFIKTEVNRKYFDSGVRAKQRGYGDMSPFYENKTADYFFKCGYAGTSFEQARETLQSEIEQILKQDSTLSESVNELTRENTIDHLYVPEDQL